MLWTIILVLVVLWALGLVSNIGGGLVHLLLVLAIIVVAFNMLTAVAAQTEGRERTSSNLCPR